MFSTYTTSLSSSSEANHHNQQLPFSSTFLHHQEDAQLLDQFPQSQPIYHYGDQQTLIDVTKPLPTGSCHRHVKKDRHSKIHTSQGFRDRRFRLSIGIARRFFDLQDMLGFDKPSKTLEWLLGNSANAIKKLGKTDSSSSHSTVSLTSSSRSNCIAGDGAKTKKMKKVVNELDALSRESRAKARARARERTLEKLISRAHCSQLILKVNEDRSPYLSASNSKLSSEDQGCKDLSNEVLIADSNNTSIISSPIHQQQNLMITKEEIYLNNLDYHFQNLPSSWDIESAINAYLCTDKYW